MKKKNKLPDLSKRQRLKYIRNSYGFIQVELGKGLVHGSAIVRLNYVPSQRLEDRIRSKLCDIEDIVRSDVKKRKSTKFLGY